MADPQQTEEPLDQNSVAMKIQSPMEEESKQENMDNEKNEFKMCAPTFRSSVTSTNPFALTQNKFPKTILKPPQLNLNSTSSNKLSFVLKPSSLNPFMAKSNLYNKPNVNDKNDSDNKQVNGEAPKFVPLIKNSSENKPSTSLNTQPQPAPTLSASNSGNSFVFGQNLQDRVIADSNKLDEPKPSTSNSSSNGTSDMLFSTALKQEGKRESPQKDKERESKSLSESAKEYEESRANKRKYEEVEVKTGEEEETNVLNISCKLFAFDKTTSNWQERGRGTLRLNDFEHDGLMGSRLVFRASGNLRVILNTKIWAEMTIEKASEKSIRLTALDSNGEVKVFLIMSSIDDTRHLYSSLQERLENEIVAQKRKKVETVEK